MKKGSRETVELIESVGDHVINYNYDGKGNDLTIMDWVKGKVDSGYETPDDNLQHFKTYVGGMRCIKEAQIKGKDWKQIWQYFKDIVDQEK